MIEEEKQKTRKTFEGFLRMARASQLYKQLNGLIAIYKTSETNIMEFGLSLKTKICSEFNKIPWEPPAMTKQLTFNPKSKKLMITTQSDLIDSPLVLGERFELDDFEMYVSDPMAEISSGVQVFGIGPAGLGDLGARFESAQLMKVYRVKCMLGRSTQDGTTNTNTVIRTTWRHVTQVKLDRLLAYTESSFQRRLFSLAGILPNSAKAYNILASGSLIRPLPPPEIPVEKTIESTGGVARADPPPMIYGIKCVDWSPPFFTLEVHLINESADFLIGLVQDIGAELKSSSLVTQIRRLRHGRINAADCLLIREISVESLLNQITSVAALHPSHTLHYMRDKFTPMEHPQSLLTDSTVVLPINTHHNHDTNVL